MILFVLNKYWWTNVLILNYNNVNLAKKLHKHICEYSFDCKIDVFSSIGYGYVKNPEFKNNFDKFGYGTAQYICDAIQQYVKESKE